jgi:hypothetical protein
MPAQEFHIRLSSRMADEVARLRQVFGMTETAPFTMALLGWAIEEICDEGPTRNHFRQWLHRHAPTSRGCTELPLGPLETLASHTGRSPGEILQMVRDPNQPGYFLASIAILVDSLAGELRYLAKRIDATQGVSARGRAEPVAGDQRH